MRMFSKTSKGFTLVEIMIVVAIIGILIAIAVPGFVKARTQSRLRACQENLSKIDGGKEQYALENQAATGAAVTMAQLCAPDGSLYIKAAATGPVCPGGGTYAVNAVGAAPTCTIAGHVLP